MPVIAISMGPLGRSTRVFGGDFGSAATSANGSFCC
ncbi:type I 3-dehydroquinate dehydratase [Brevibacterium paucivorans]|nr:type I 3-dehydroquinate dehydratase [Brevibacterium paucivorans]